MGIKGSDLYNLVGVRTIALLSFIILSFTIKSQERFPSASVLKDGNIYKFQISESGVYKITKSLLGKAGITQNVNPNQIKLYGIKGGVLEENIGRVLYNDLYELPCEVIGGEDNSFDNADEILFYAEGSTLWKYDQQNARWEYRVNPYDQNAYIYLKVDNTPSLKIKKQSINQVQNNEFRHSVFKQVVDDDRVNLLTREINTQGSGQQWFGEGLRGNDAKTISGIDLTKYVAGDQVDINISVAVRSSQNTTVELKIGGNTLTQTAFGVSLNDIESYYVSIVRFTEKITLTNPLDGIKVTLKDANSSTEAWIDQVNVVGKSETNYNGTQLSISNPDWKNRSGYLNISQGAYKVKAYKINNFDDVESIDLVNDRLAIEAQNSLSEYFVFHREGCKEPTFKNKIDNQNLHGITQAEWVVIYPKKLEKQAKKLTLHRKTYDKVDTASVALEQIYEEFSGGRTDVTAIRNFAKMIKERSPKFKYLLLLGDASYDIRDIIKGNKESTLIPAYQTRESVHPVLAFPSDDYFGLLSEGEGLDLIGSLEVAVGRLPVKNEAEATNLVDKIIRYDTDPKRFGSWRSNLTFSADDEDFNIHLVQADRLATNLEDQKNDFQVSKVYLDAYKQKITPAGPLYPDVNLTLNNRISTGTLVFCYLGHGGPNGLAEEKVLQIPDIKSWKNVHNPSVLITATCSFTGYDNPTNVSAGEEAILSTNGGAIALFSTTRAVYSSENERITNSVFKFLFEKNGDNNQRFGDVLLSAKNFQGIDTISINTRKFAFFGDPGQRIAAPKYNIKLDRINGRPAIQNVDTVSAFEKLTIEGRIVDASNKLLNNFNGTLELTIFDKVNNTNTLANDSRSYKYNFKQFRNIVFKGQASVEGGKFKTEMIIPSDISYDIGNAKIFMYAYDTAQDAQGSFDGLFIGGEPTTSLSNNEAPKMNLFINDESFINGGITNSNPILVANLRDDLGIKVTGNSIGHDLSLNLIGPVGGKFIMNDFYRSNVNDFRSGVARFPLPTLKPGQYEAFVKAWDIGNKSVEGSIKFEVVDEENIGELPVFAYPNPFTFETKISVEHDQNGREIELTLEIFDTKGAKIRNIKLKKNAFGSREASIKWDGKDEMGHDLAKGLYFYKILINTPSLDVKRISKYGKLIKS